MQDMEFTIDRGKLYLLQTRDGKRTAQAEVRIAVDMVEEGLISKEEAVQRVHPDQVDFFLHPQLDAEAMREADVIATGLITENDIDLKTFSLSVLHSSM